MAQPQKQSRSTSSPRLPHSYSCNCSRMLASNWARKKHILWRIAKSYHEPMPRFAGGSRDFFEVSLILRSLREQRKGLLLHQMGSYSLLHDNNLRDFSCSPLQNGRRLPQSRESLIASPETHILLERKIEHVHLSDTELDRTPTPTPGTLNPLQNDSAIQSHEEYTDGNAHDTDSQPCSTTSNPAHVENKTTEKGTRRPPMSNNSFHQFASCERGGLLMCIRIPVGGRQCAVRSVLFLLSSAPFIRITLKNHPDENLVSR